jgi:cytochrome c5
MKSGILAFCAALGTIVAAATPVLAVQNQGQPQAAQQSADSRPANSHGSEVKGDGERVFEQNCARCHNSPNGFSSRISGTIMRHMRVRANLSRQDEEALLKYFNQ